MQILNFQVEEVLKLQRSHSGMINERVGYIFWTIFTSAANEVKKAFMDLKTKEYGTGFRFTRKSRRFAELALKSRTSLLRKLFGSWNKRKVAEWNTKYYGKTSRLILKFRFL
jgi:hypothetical protein